MAEPYHPTLLVRLRAVNAALTAAGYEHAVGGAIALAVHVRDPRFTSDIDLNVIADALHPEPLLACMPDGVVVHDSAAEEIRSSGQTRLIWPDPMTPVDLFLPQHPIYHRLVTDRAESADFLGAGIKVISATDLMVFKMMFNRSKDWVDIETLLEAGAGDPTEAARWIADFLGEDDVRLSRLRELVADRDRSAR